MIARTARVGIIGLGYVGLPLARAFAEAGYPVLGFDTDPAKVGRLARGESYIGHIPDAVVGSMLGSSDLRHLLIGGDSTDAFGPPVSVKTWINIRNEGDGLATTLPFGRDILTAPPADEPDHHEMVSYLRNSVGAGAILGGWCAAFGAKAPAGCESVER